MTFKEFIQKRIEQTRCKASLVLTPNWEDLPPQVKENYRSIGAGLFAFYKALLDGTKDKAAAVILNIASFEAYGLSGIICLKSTIDYAKSLGLIVIADTEKPANLSGIHAYFRSWVAPVDDKLPEDSPLRAGAFDCDALTFAGSLSNVEVQKKIATELERYGAGALVSTPEEAKAIGKENCGVLLRGECNTILNTLKGHNDCISVGCPTGFQKPEELKDLGAVCTLVAAPKEIQSPAAFLKFAQLI